MTDTFITLPSLRSIVEKNGLLPNHKHTKNYGQNFIFDENITDKIVRFAHLPASAIVIEVGPGPGGLSRSILKKDPHLLLALEYDPLCVKALDYLNSFDNFKVLYEDALNFIIEKIYEFTTDNTSKIHIVSNLPYNIASELLTRWLHKMDHIQSMTLMFQKEVADRICGAIDTKEYGRLSIISQLCCDIDYGFVLPPHIFTPAPKIYSSVLRFTPKENYSFIKKYLNNISSLTHCVFQQRRKQIKTPLKNIFGDKIIDILTSLEISPEKRAENLTPHDYLLLAQEMQKLHG